MADEDPKKFFCSGDEEGPNGVAEPSEGQELPPSYVERAERFVPEIPPLDFRDPGPPQSSTVSKDQCIAHLKLLSALADLREAISTNDGLFGIHDSQADKFVFEDHRRRAHARVREKRWAIYTARAVDRFTAWWTICVPTWGNKPTPKDFTDIKYSKITHCASRIEWMPDNMPPLDVLMVWHSYMLNPRAFLEDCIRNSKMNFWATGLPWGVINACIDNRFDYEPGNKAKSEFENRVRRQWDNLSDSPEKTLDCVRCQKPFTVPWTRGEMSPELETAFETATGYADKGFIIVCSHCGYLHSHDRLRVDKFRKDVEVLLQDDLPMPGTLYNINGLPEWSNNPRSHQGFPNRLIRACSQKLLRSTDTRLNEAANSMEKLRDFLELQIKDRHLLQQVNGSGFGSLNQGEKIAFRRMMSRYWENHSPFALDLVGAVIRQGTFVQKMDDLDWIHSPALTETMDRLIQKYGVFFQIMVSNKKRMAVPTLDVDLAWHTHQLSPSRYFDYSKIMTGDIFIDHDDKVDENRLSHGFEWTSKEYKKLTNGKIYSECTCWYCEATREPILRRGLPFNSSSTIRARSAAKDLHNDPNISSDPGRSPHISAHNAVRVQGLTESTHAKVNELQLRNKHQKAIRRQQKQRDKEASRDGENDSKKKEASANGVYDAYFYSPMVWGYPYYVPYYAPYMCDPSVNSNVYVSNPACMNVGAMAYGNCAAGTCGGGVAAGACGGMGGCVGGSAGGCGGSSAGGCGGGGGGGCGGFGGGCGGGGGGGGGCGGGGGGC